HVAGTLAGDGHDSNGRLAGIAPGVSLVSLKALDAGGSGRLTDVLRALNWLAKNAGAHHIRVVNLSFGTPVTESYWQDPLALATKALVDGGVVIVVAAGNEGRDDKAHKVWGAVTSPANAPWVITVGASSTMGTLTRSDDEVAGFSSRGPTRIEAAGQGGRVPVEAIWSKQFFWGNHRITGGIMVPDANAWDRKTVWGAVKTLGDAGDNIVWGTSCGSSDCGDNIVWGTAGDGDNIVWGTSGDGDNIVWGTSADGPWRETVAQRRIPDSRGVDQTHPLTS